MVYNSCRTIRKAGDNMKDRLVLLRKSLGLSQKAFGEPLNLSRSTVGNYELGERILTDRTISDICRV